MSSRGPGRPRRRSSCATKLFRVSTPTACAAPRTTSNRHDEIASCPLHASQVACTRTSCALHSMLAMPDWNRDVGWAGAVGKFATCSTSPDSARFDVLAQWEATLMAGSYNVSVFGRTANLYTSDRCFVPRRICKLRLRTSSALPRGAELLLPRDAPGQTHLFPGRFDVVLGAAQAVGVLTRNSFVAQLERRRGLPVVNLARGAAGPHIYTDPLSWPAIAPLLTSARAVIICLTAGRSSPNSESGAFSGNAFGAEQLSAYERMVKLERRGNVQHAKRLRDESLRTAMAGYVELVRRIRAGPTGRSTARSTPGTWDGRSASSTTAATPRVLLVWFSSCPLAGCAEHWLYPQYYTSPAPLRALQAALDAQLVDASYSQLKPSPPLAIDQCASCMPAITATAVCDSMAARRDGTRSRRCVM